MKRLFLTILVVGFCLLASAQQPTQTDTVVPNDSTEMPTYPGGPEAYRKFLRKNIHYPEICGKKGIQGRVICSYIVEEDGSITDVQVRKSVHPSLDKEAVRVIQSMPKWNPGKENGLPVRVRYNLPITFSLK